ncbi:hypothetical protein [Hansschlegelia sp.]|uniref:hypothetical protein n=1 Tax=Hansschlegelia sp. TaxID=2041892 RepID=UPI002C8E9905|nr:hypothetical protein [Hansschlegelia sp.]HVI28711.1 hypothetical protein [Hansschlegelia sp.]
MKKLFLAATAALAVLSLSPAEAAEKNIGFFGSWSVWQYSDAGGKGCFIYANPSKAEPARLNHGLVSFFIRSVGKSPPRTEASLQFGYAVDPNGPSWLSVDGKKFRLQTYKSGAWLAGGKPRERDLLKAMKSGRSMRVSTASRRGNETHYVFPLNGVTRAMGLLRRRCS